MRNLTILALAAALAACGTEPATETNAAANQSVADPAATDPVSEEPAAPPSDGTTAPSPSPTGTPSPSPTETPEQPEDDEATGRATIPAPLRGRWGLVAADCTSTRGDAKGLLNIDRDSLRFYESVARLGRVIERDRSRIVATFSFTGEGMNWQRRVTLDGQDGGKTLIRRENGEGAAPGPFRYTRCEAA